ncbi:MAG: zinc metallopeptidase [Clostridiales bacterium]|nr:zinc metallopeptidase [Clostridiales bacterium]
MYYYIISIGVMLLCAAIGASASMKVHRAFNKYGNMPTQSRMTGYDTARRLLRSNGVNDISVGKVRGHLSDHYHPTKKVVNLSESTFGSDSIAAVAVAAHEIGHVMQKKKGYPLYKLRQVLVPITNIGSALAMPLVLIGLILDFAVASTQNSDMGWYLALAGVALYGLSTVFALVTLPVEFNASRRAKQMLVAEGVLTKEELPYADKMLDAAANTYVASLLTSLIYFLRFALWVFIMFGGRRRDD